MKVLTLNTNGLGKILKRQAYFKIFEKYDICCIQEAFFDSNTTIEEWKVDWPGELFSQPGPPGIKNSGGLLIFINEKCAFTNVNKIEINERILGVSFYYNNRPFTFYNVYAPAAKEQRVPFFEGLPLLLKPTVNNEHVFFCGDFNNLMNNELDNISGHPHGVNEINAFVNFTNICQLTDSFRHLYPCEKQFTWSRVSTNNDNVNSSVTFSARRLDYIFLNLLAKNFLVNTEIVHFSSSDHKAVVCTLNYDDLPRGKTFWKFNESLLNDSNFKDEMSTFISEHYNELLQEEHDFKDSWDLLKLSIRDKCIAFSRNKLIEARNKNFNLDEEINFISNKLIDSPNDIEMIEKMVELRRKKEVFDLAESNGAMKRAKQKMIEEWEKNGSYFLGIEQSQQRQHTIKEVYNSNNKCVNSSSQVLSELSNFYKNLMNEKPSNNLCENHDIFIDNYLKNCEYPILAENQKQDLDTPVTETDFNETLKYLNTDSSPGSDGLSALFYQFFWPQLKTPLFNCCVESFKSGTLTISQRKSILTLLLKSPDSDPREISNYRPISVTNFDYRLISLVLARKLQKVIKDIVHKSQTGFIEGRTINEHVRLLDDVIKYANTEKLEGILVSLDFRKAFDTLSRASIKSTLKKFNFGENFISYVLTLLNRSSASVKNGGWFSEFFNTDRGVRQGCALSPLLFVLVAEVLAIRIRNNKEIDGISENFDKNISYADDASLFLKALKDLKICLHDIDLFSAFSGLDLNRKKCIGMWLGKDKDNPPGDEGISWLKKGENLKILGIFFNASVEASLIPQNWENKIKSIESLIDKWAKRYLTLIGKCLVSKTFFLSVINNVIQSLALPPHILQKIDNMIFSFIWSTESNRNGKEKLKRDTLCLDKYKGGISMISVVDQQSAFMCKWVTRICSKSSKAHFSIVDNFLSCIGGIDYVIQTNVKSEEFMGLTNIKSYYWQQAVKSWLDLNKKDFQLKKWEIQNCPTPLFNNSDIRFKNRILFFPKWFEKGLIHSNDFISNGRFKSYEEIKSVLGEQGHTLFQYFALKNAIIRSKLYPNILLSNQSTRFAFDFTKVENKLIRNTFLKDRIGPLQCLDTWSKKLEIDITPYFMVYLKATKETKLHALQFKILHYTYPTNKILQKMRIKQNDKCDNCSEIETLQHLFFECRHLLNFWYHVSSVVSDILGKKIKLNITQALFGILPNEIQCPLQKINMANHLIMVAKMCISNAKSFSKYNNLRISFECERGLRFN